MSSPIAKTSHELNFVHRALNVIHGKISHAKRIDVLSDQLTIYFKELVGDNKNVRCLDVGCGDLGIQERIAEHVPGTVWECLDIYDLPEHLRQSAKWSNYRKFNGKDLPFDDDSVDIVLFCDALHHANSNAVHLLKEAHRIGKIVIIKDSFEYSCYSRWMLKIMDFVGNWGYGVPLPEKYFTIAYFKQLCEELNFEIKKMNIGIQIYAHIPIIRSLLRPEWHFSAMLKKINRSSTADYSSCIRQGPHQDAVHKASVSDQVFSLPYVRPMSVSST